MSEMIPASILLEKAKFDDRIDAYSTTGEYYNRKTEHHRLMPLLEAAVKIIEVQAREIDWYASPGIHEPWRAQEAQAKVQEILGGIE